MTLYPYRELTITSKVQECFGWEFAAKLGEFDNSMSDNFLVEAKMVVMKEWGNRVVGCRREVVKLEELKKTEKTGVPGQVERDI